MMMTVIKYAAKIGLSPQRVRQLIHEDRMRPRAKKFGTQCMLSSKARAINPARGGPKSRAAACPKRRRMTL